MFSRLLAARYWLLLYPQTVENHLKRSYFTNGKCRLMKFSCLSCFIFRVFHYWIPRCMLCCMYNIYRVCIWHNLAAVQRIEIDGSVETCWEEEQTTSSTRNRDVSNRKYQKKVSWLYRMTLARNSQKRLATKMMAEPTQPSNIDLQNFQQETLVIHIGLSPC